MRRKSQISLRDLALAQDLKQLKFPCKDNTNVLTFFFFSSEGEDFVLQDISPMEHIINVQILVLFSTFCILCPHIRLKGLLC